jgi:hypothetical protein
METMHAAGRRRLPPVPRPAGDRAAGQLTVKPVADRADTELIDTRQIASELIDAELAALTTATPPPAGDGPAGADAGATDAAGSGDAEQIEPSDVAAGAAAATAPKVAEPEVEDSEVEEPPEAADAVDPEVADETADDGPGDEQDPAQQFVARLRSSAADFAAAAGADSAVVREAVPPARHRRARCRLVLRYADGHVADVTFLGPAGVPGRPSRHGFDRQILRWLAAGPSPDDAWVVADADAPDGVAVDLSAWAATG